MEIRDVIRHIFVGFMLMLISRIVKAYVLDNYAGESGFISIINVISNMMACLSVVVVIGGIVGLVSCIKRGRYRWRFYKVRARYTYEYTNNQAKKIWRIFCKK